VKVLSRTELANKEKITIQIPGTKPGGMIRFGLGVSKEIGVLLKGITTKKGLVLFVVDPIIITLQRHHDVISSIEAHGYSTFLFSEVNPEPSIGDVVRLKNIIKDLELCAVIGLGGGSALDIAKFAALLSVSDSDPLDLMLNPSKIAGSLPSILIPTTSGTGSEVSPFIVMNNEGKKLYIQSPYCYAAIALIDPELTITMPAKVTASTGFDALSHAVEGVVGNDNPFTRALSIECVKLIFQFLPSAFTDGNDIVARYYMSLASTLGMLVYTQGGGLYTHSLSYVLTSRYHLPHGVGCGLGLPYTLKFNRRHVESLLIDYAQALLLPDIRDTNAVFVKFFSLLQKVEMPTNLEQLGVTEDEIPLFAKSLVDDYYRHRNPRVLDEESALLLVRAMYNGNLADVP
jgi:alcohol dehydrogenase class IV